MGRERVCIADKATGLSAILMTLALSAGLMASTAAPVYAGEAQKGVLVAEAATAPAAGGDRAKTDGLVRHIDHRIARLHRQLHITADQEPKFQAFADVMRNNAQAMHGMLLEHGQTGDDTAVAKLRWFAQLTSLHADALNKLVPVFDALYLSLSDKQKEQANRVFDEIGVRRPPHHHHAR